MIKYFTRTILFCLSFLPLLSLAQSDYSKLYWPNYEAAAIERINFNGTGRETLVTNAGEPIAIEVDVKNQKVYWFDQSQNAIRRANFDGSGQVVFVANSGYAYTLELDAAGGKLYWPNYEGRSIESINLDGTGRTTVVNLTVPVNFGPINVALDKVNNKIYWLEDMPVRILRANLDGTGAEVVIADPGYSYNLVIDQTARKLYWSNYEARSIERSNMDGTGRETVVANVSGLNYGAISLALDKTNNKIYWFDDLLYGIRRANLDGTGMENFITNSGYPYTLIVPVQQSLLPVDLVAFDAKAGACSVDIRWTTANALQFSYFEIERSLNGSSFTALSEIPYSAHQQHYSFTDLNAGTGDVTYRLKMMDTDGSYRFSKTVRLKAACSGMRLRVFPNPVTTEVFVSTGKKIREIHLLSLTGQVLFRYLPTGAETATIKMTLPESISKGVYVLKVTAEDGSIEQTKIIRQ